MSLAEFAKQLCAELLLIGRGGIIVDVEAFDESEIRTLADEKRARAESGQRLFPYLGFYPAESIISWSKSSVILLETAYETDAVDRFKQVAIPQIRELSLVDGIYQIQLWRQTGDAWKKEWTPHDEPIIPRSRRGPFHRIPFFALSYVGPGNLVAKPPLLGLCNLAIAHYRLGADLAHGLHFTALPTFYIAGGDKDQPVALGSATALILSDPNAKAGYCEFSGSGLGAIERAIAVKEHQMAALGAAIIASEIRKSETAEAARIRHSGETSLMSGVVASVEAGLEAALKFAAEWACIGGAEIAINLNDQFIAEKLDAQTLTALVAAYQAGAMTLESFLQVLQDGDLIEPKVDLVAEAAALRRSGPPTPTKAAA